MAVAIDGKQAHGLLRLAVKATGLTAKEPVRIVAEPQLRFRQRRVTLFDRGYPRAAQAHAEKATARSGWSRAATACCAKVCWRSTLGPACTTPLPEPCTSRPEAVLVALDWDSEVDATQWETAVEAYLGAAFGTGIPTECAASACWIFGGRTVAFDHLGVHTALVVSDDVRHAGELARAAASTR